MNRKLSQQIFGVQLLALLACIAVGLFLVAIASVAVVYANTGALNADAFANLDFTNPANLALLKQLIPLQTILFFGVPAIAFAFFADKNLGRYIGLRPVVKPVHILLAIVAILAGLYFVGLLAQINKAIPMPQSWINTETDYAVLTKSLLTMHNVTELLVNLFVIALLPAICEELLFRGCIQNMLIQQLGKHQHWLAIVITGVVFGLIHGQMQTVLPRIFLGIVLGFIYYYSNSIYPSILAHFFNNGLQVVLTYLIANHTLSTDVMDDSNIVPTGYGLLSGVVCIALMFILYKTKQAYTMQVANDNHL
jgi:uncharacterized protein